MTSDAPQAAEAYSTTELLKAEVIRADGPYRKILVPTDGYALSGVAIVHGTRLAAQIGASLVFVTVTAPFQPLATYSVRIHRDLQSHRKDAKERADRILAPAAAVAEAGNVRFETLHVENDEPYLGIIRAAEDNGCDLVVMASHGRRGLSALVLGSETVKVLTHSSIPVLVCRQPREA